MLRNYLNVALRNIVRNKVHSSINVVGLAIGLASFVLIFLYVTDELSYDRYHEKADRTYRVASLVEGAENSASMSFPVAPALLAEYPDRVESATRLFNFQAPAMTISHTSASGDIVRYNESRFFFADSTTFEGVVPWRDRRSQNVDQHNLIFVEPKAGRARCRHVRRRNENP